MRPAHERAISPDANSKARLPMALLQPSRHPSWVMLFSERRRMTPAHRHFCRGSDLGSCCLPSTSVSIPLNLAEGPLGPGRGLHASHTLPPFILTTIPSFSPPWSCWLPCCFHGYRQGPPHSLCTCCVLCLEGSFPREPHGLLPHLLQSIFSIGPPLTALFRMAHSPPAML